jgi:hypothetical protein
MEEEAAQGEEEEGQAAQQPQHMNQCQLRVMEFAVPYSRHIRAGNRMRQVLFTWQLKTKDYY